MNYLAHCYLAEETAESLVGSLMGDFVKGSLLAGYPEGIRRGISLHRRVDAFTDAHPVVLRSKRRFRPECRRYAGIVVDVVYDHFLARGWERYSAVPLPTFAAMVYRVLQAHDALLPERLRGMVARMAAENWLVGYRDLDAVRAALARVARRIPRENPLAQATGELDDLYPALEADFAAFFPDLVEHVAQVEW